jgi:eukaryotic-like serine/threonine-protein kinase
VTPDRWRAVTDIFHAALARDATSREAFVADACKDDGALRAEVAALLAAHAEAGSFGDATVDAANTPRLNAGTMLGPYRIDGWIGAGGMGEVYRATDTRLGRTVAIKILPAHLRMSSDLRARFDREARVISQITHPHICTLHDVGHEGDIDFLVMEYLEGETLAERICRGPVEISDALRHGIEIADALAAAHRARFVHGDVKPANVMVGAFGAKLLDFGVARALRPQSSAEGTATATVTTRRTVAGTPGYMAPELWQGAAPSARSDVWALGMLIDEMLTGEHGSTSLPSDTPPLLAHIVERAVAEDPVQRYASATEMLADLVACRREIDRAEASSMTARAFVQLRSPRVIAVVTLIVVILATLAALGWYSRRKTEADIRAARQRIPELVRLVDAGKQNDAFRLARAIERVLPDDPSLAAAWPAISVTGTLESRPAGAEVDIKPYEDVTGEWIHLGKTPLQNVRVPAGRLRVRATKDGYEPVLVARTGTMLVRSQKPMRGANVAEMRLGITFGLDLQPRGPATARMVLIPPLKAYSPLLFYGFPSIPLVDLPYGWLDKFEVSNREYKMFVDAGAYSRRDYWPPFVQDGRTISWTEGMKGLVDMTGRPGPSGWQLGEYADGQDDLPVSGVSWYEAAAYANWAGKALPTVHDWIRAAATLWAPDVLPLSNVATAGRRPTGLIPVGTSAGVSEWGVYDMAGNVKEWTANRSTDDRRIVLGGAWDESDYMFFSRDERDPFNRSLNVGFRCARYPDGPSAAALSWTPDRQRSYDAVKPVPERTFEMFRGVYEYDRAPLQAQIDAVAPADGAGWRRETVSYSGPGGVERMTAYLFVPTRAAPPFQAVVYFPGSAATQLPSSAQNVAWPDVTFLAKSGRLVMFPVYKGTFERITPETERSLVAIDSIAYRDLQIDLTREVRRAVDYLMSRGDVDRERLVYYGLSWGAVLGPIPLALEPRLRTAVLVSGGLYWMPLRPEADPANFLPRVTQPVLMINGQYDGFYVAASRQKFFDLLGSPDKKFMEIPGAGHAGPRAVSIGETLAWLDRHLGPVRPK